MGIFSDYVACYTCKLFKHFAFLYSCVFTRVLCIYVPLNLSSMNKHPSSRYWILTFYYTVRYYWIWKSKSDNNLNEKIRCEVNTVTIHQCIRNTRLQLHEIWKWKQIFRVRFRRKSRTTRNSEDSSLLLNILARVSAFCQ